ncbi:MAG: Gfo/Idh/MocA family oxidoreductase [Planctomycetes bacterium]|nr:Gfo/Idh/MocA family oxidoreductase [Planctomycetota bacterium]
MPDLSPIHRRSALKAGAALAAASALPASLYAAANEKPIRVGLVGCGGRGTGAAHNVLHAAPNVVVTAVGDAFESQAKGCQGRLNGIGKDDARLKELGNKVDLPDDRVFWGLDAYKKVINCPDVDYVILATPPGFRPLHITEAVNAGKHVFTEKPVGVDGPGIRAVLKAFDEANKKKLGAAAGTQRRHQLAYIETIKKIHDGAIGELVTGRAYWNQGILWTRARKEGMTDLEYQMWNWYNYTWICGDHVVEQHVHNLDVLNWCFNEHPKAVIAMGGRSRNKPEYGHIFDFFSAQIEYSGDRHCISMARQISNCWNSVTEFVSGTKGNSHVGGFTINGKPAIERTAVRKAADPYVQEHTDLIESIRKGQPINELKNVAESTLTAIMVRESAYTGQRITWEQMLNSNKVYLDVSNLNKDIAVPEWKVAVPGSTQLS